MLNKRRLYQDEVEDSEGEEESSEKEASDTSSSTSDSEIAEYSTAGPLGSKVEHVGVGIQVELLPQSSRPFLQLTQEGALHNNRKLILPRKVMLKAVWLERATRGLTLCPLIFQVDANNQVTLQLVTITPKEPADDIEELRTELDRMEYGEDAEDAQMQA